MLLQILLLLVNLCIPHSMSTGAHQYSTSHPLLDRIKNNAPMVFVSQTAPRTSNNKINRVDTFVVAGTEKSLIHFLNNLAPFEIDPNYTGLIGLRYARLNKRGAMHVFGVQIERFVTPEGNIRTIFSGHHYDPAGLLERSGLFTVLERRPLNQLAYTVKLQENVSGKILKKNRFADTLSQSDIINILAAALKNIVEQPTHEYGRWQLTGQYRDLLLKIIIDNQGNVVSFYPFKKSYHQQRQVPVQPAQRQAPVQRQAPAQPVQAMQRQIAAQPVQRQAPAKPVQPAQRQAPVQRRARAQRPYTRQPRRSAYQAKQRRSPYQSKKSRTKTQKPARRNNRYQRTKRRR